MSPRDDTLARVRASCCSGGYRWGVQRKRALLERERAAAARERSESSPAG